VSEDVQQAAGFKAQFHRRSLATVRVDPVDSSRRYAKRVSSCVCWIDPENPGKRWCWLNSKSPPRNQRPNPTHSLMGKGGLFSYSRQGRNSGVSATDTAAQPRHCT